MQYAKVSNKQAVIIFDHRMKHKSSNKKYMKKALKLAAQGVFSTAANPRVGCVLVSAHENKHEIIGAAFHQRVGAAHAEAMALHHAGARAKGATAYVTLEPCSHFGKNPPCANALIDAQVAKVVVCNDDPNPLVAGQGYKKLAQAGIEVVKGVLADQGQDLNRGFLHRMQTGIPWVRVKLAQSIDGRTAMASGESYWITGKQSRADVHYWRGRSGAIITGVETVIADDCQLNFRPQQLASKYRKLCKNVQVNQPLRVIIDSHLRTPLRAKILHNPEQVIIVTAVDDSNQSAPYEALGVQVKAMPGKAGLVDLHQVIRYLGMQEINEVLVESGATLAGAFMAANVVDELIIYTAPVIMGSSARPLLKINIEEMSDRHHIKVISTKSFGKDWRIRALVKA